MQFKLEYEEINLWIDIKPLDEGHDYEFVSITLDDSNIDIQNLVLASPMLLKYIDDYLNKNFQELIDDHNNFMMD